MGWSSKQEQIFPNTGNSLTMWRKHNHWVLGEQKPKTLQGFVVKQKCQVGEAKIHFLENDSGVFQSYLLRFRVLGYGFWGPVMTPPHVWCFGWKMWVPQRNLTSWGFIPYSFGEVMGRWIRGFSRSLYTTFAYTKGGLVAKLEGWNPGHSAIVFFLGGMVKWPF